MVRITECPRDAMQGIKEFIPTQSKINYINSLLKVGFDTIDFGSFVSPKAIPQMKDTTDVLKGLNLDNTSSKLLAIIANQRGAEDACQFDEITYLGFPFSISETFQQRNTNSSIEESLKRVEDIQELCLKHNKKMLVYISMAFGNPYGDDWHPDIAIDWTKRLHEDLGIKYVALADTIGISDKKNIEELFSSLIPEVPTVEFGAHLHTTQEAWQEKVEAAYHAGCRKFDSAMKGYGGCPMAKDDLTGNLATENLYGWLKQNSVESGLNEDAFNKALFESSTVFH